MEKLIITILGTINEGKSMTEIETAISVIGTLSGTLLGLIVGMWIESKREKHETSIEYRRELTKHLEDVVKPLNFHTQQMWGSLAVLQRSVELKSSIIKGKTINDLILETQEAMQNLKSFILEKSAEIDLLFPHSLSSWVFAPIDEKIEILLTQVLDGKQPYTEITQVINALMKYQKNLKKLLGYETDVKLEDVYPFPEINIKS
jgi:hypothetical protein